MTPARIRIAFLAVALVLLASVAASWWFESRTASTVSPARGAGNGSGAAASAVASAGAAAYRVRVTRDGRELASFDLVTLQAMGMKSVVVQGGTEVGPPLLTVLAQAGAGDFSSVTIVGPGSRDSGRLVLQRSAIGPDTVLDIAKRGTVKVAGPNIPYDDRVRDITEIQVR